MRRFAWLMERRLVRPCPYIWVGGWLLLSTLSAPQAAFGQTPSSGAGGKATADSSAGFRSLNITVPAEGEYFVRLLPSPDAREPAQLPIRFTDSRTTITFNPSVLGKSPRIAIDDARTGNTAILPLPAGDKLELRRSDFDHVRRVEVRVTFENRPVQVARVSLTTSDKKTQYRTIDSTAQGIAAFEDVPVGKAKLSLVYGDRLTETRDVEITSDHPTGVLVIPAAVSNRVPTLEAPSGSTPASSPTGGAGGAPALPSSVPPSPPPSATTPSTPPTPQGGGLSGLIEHLIGLAVAAGAIYLLYRWAQTGGMAATLKKIGIETSGPTPASDTGTPWQPNPPAAPVVTDPTLCPFCGQKKDAAGNCACTATDACARSASGAAAPGAGMSVGVPPTPSQPRLVATMGVYSGSIFPLALNGGGLTVGRDASNTISLPNDSTVSRRHATLRAEGGNYIITDEGSSNGIYVNGVKISGSQVLRPGDEVQIGNTRFRFEV